MAETATIQRETQPGVTLTVLTRESQRELFIVMRPRDEETPQAMFQRLADILTRYDAEILRQDILCATGRPVQSQLESPVEHSSLGNE